LLIEVQAQWSDGVPFDFTSLFRAFVVWVTLFFAGWLPAARRALKCPHHDIEYGPRGHWQPHHHV